MNHLRIYSDIIANALQRPLIQGYSEVHHIVPTCMGGDDIDSNKVVLTGREHYLCHWLLYKIHGGKLVYAWYMMTYNPFGKRYTSHSFQYAREMHAKEIGKIVSKALTGRKLPEETKRKVSKALKGRKGQPRSAKTRRKISAALKGKPGHSQSIESRRKISLAQKGRKMSEAEVAKMIAAVTGVRKAPRTQKHCLHLSISRKNSPVVVCPYCNKTGQKSVMTRWHFENCKLAKGS